MRRDVAPNLVEEIILYFAEWVKNESEFRTQLACLGVQRNLRILGVFSRLARQEGKTEYLKLLPRVWKNLQLDLQHPSLTELRQAVNDILPSPQTNAVKTATK